VGIKQGFGWEYATVRFFRKVQENHLRYPGEIERLLHILQSNGLRVDPDYTFALKIMDQDIGYIRKEAEAIQKERNKPLIGVVVGAKRPQNRWPLPFFRVIVEQLVKTYNVVVIGGPEDIPLADTLADLPGVFIRCGRYTPIQSGLMLRHCELCLSNDTGPMHLAYSFGTPVVALFSARDFPYKWFPPESNLNVVLRKYDIHCSLCLTETCANNICMQAILPIEVSSAINQVLAIKKLPLIDAINHVSSI
jgi:heptosyltransferase-2